MMIEDLLREGHTLSRWARHRFVLLVVLVILVALFLVGVALALYASSGAAQLDLSRPGYKSVRDQAVRTSSFNGYPTTGTLDKDAVSQFRRLYDEQAEKATNVDSFSGGAMSDKALSIDDPGAE